VIHDHEKLPIIAFPESRRIFARLILGDSTTVKIGVFANILKIFNGD